MSIGISINHPGMEVGQCTSTSASTGCCRFAVLAPATLTGRRRAVQKSTTPPLSSLVDPVQFVLMSSFCQLPRVVMSFRLLILLHLIIVSNVRSFPSRRRLFESVNSVNRHNWQGSRMDDAITYLRQFGYVGKDIPLTESTIFIAIKAFQEVVGLPNDGVLTELTMEQMLKPRCGNADLKSGMTIADKRRSKRFAQVSRWQNKLDDDDVLVLKWHIQRYTNDIGRSEIRYVVAQAFQLWSNQIGIPSLRNIKLRFEETSDPTQSDISIMWAEGDHGDQYKFDGGGNVTNILAHTFYPNYQETGLLNGDIHFDDFEKWVLGMDADRGTYFPYVLVHEIGHALGLGHSKRQQAVMNPIYKKESLDTISLDLDDKCAINWNYVGPTNMCLFVWLMAEVLPLAKDNPVNGNSGISTISTGNDGDESSSSSVLQNILRGGTFEQKINDTFRSLKHANIPLCSDTNDVQVRYEVLLEQRLDFPRESARQYSTVACNFMLGLREQTGLMDDDESPMNMLTVHQYQHLDGADFIRLSRTSGRGKNRRRRHRRHRSTIFDKEYYNLHFYRRLLRIYLAHSV